MSRDIASGSVGRGVIAPPHVQSYARLDGVTVRWACDLALDRARRLVLALYKSAAGNRRVRL